jgi:hypothetical protein
MDEFEDAEFDWDNLAEESVIADERRAIAVYENPMGQIVIRQQAFDGSPDEDPFICIPREILPKLLKALQGFLDPPPHDCAGLDETGEALSAHTSGLEKAFGLFVKALGKERPELVRDFIFGLRASENRARKDNRHTEEILTYERLASWLEQTAPLPTDDKSH